MMFIYILTINIRKQIHHKYLEKEIYFAQVYSFYLYLLFIQ